MSREDVIRTLYETTPDPTPEQYGSAQSVVGHTPVILLQYDEREARRWTYIQYLIKVAFPDMKHPADRPREHGSGGRTGDLLDRMVPLFPSRDIVDRD
jgi:hypothetical protein